MPAASGTIDYLSWEGYDLPDIMTPWETTNNVKIAPTYIADHNEIQAKLKGGGDAVSYDIITYYQGYKPLYASLDILTPLDDAKIPNLSGQFEYFNSDVGNFWLDADGTRTGVPWTWGSFGITYNTAETSEPTSWYDLLDPKFKGKVGTVSDPVGGVTLTSRLLGYNPATLTQDQYTKVKDLFQQFVDQTNGVSASYGDLTTKLVAGDVIACYEGWAAVNSFAAGVGCRHDQDGHGEGGKRLVLRRVGHPADGGQRRHLARLDQRGDQPGDQREGGRVPGRRGHRLWIGRSARRLDEEPLPVRPARQPAREGTVLRQPARRVGRVRDDREVIKDWADIVAGAA